MDTKTIDLLHSHYIIDGAPQGLTPSQMLKKCPGTVMGADPGLPSASIVDETHDSDMRPIPTDTSKIDEYLLKMKECCDSFPVGFAECYTKNLIAASLIQTIWRNGHFRLDDLAVSAHWRWDPSRVGNCAAFYQSVQALSDYLDSLGLELSDFGYEQSDSCMPEIGVSLNSFSAASDADSLFDELTFRTGSPSLEEGRKCSDKIIAKAQDWLVYIPFETSEYRFGGSLFASSQGYTGSTAPQMDDPDYFIDCYEVVRELVEDGIVKAGVSVSRGGLMTALSSFASQEAGIAADVSTLSSESGQDKIVKLVFAEVPGVLIQIEDSDFDYVDAELLLQDVAFYPLGHPRVGKPGVEIVKEGKSDIRSILQALMRTSSEGED